MSVKVRVKRNRVYLDVIQNRVHHWESLGIALSADTAERKEQLKLADICRAKRETQILCGQWNLTDPVNGRKTLIEYARELAEGVNVKAPLYRTVKYIEQFRDNGNIQLSQITAEWVSDFQDYLLNDTGLSQMTASHYATSLRQILNKAVKSRIITADPADTVKGIPIPETNKPTLTIEELKRLADTPINGKLGAEVKRGFLFACNTGLRISDITTLTWGDIEQRQVNDRNEYPYWIHKMQKKTKHYVSIPLNENAWSLIQPRGFSTAYVFPTLAVSGTHTDQYIKDWAKRAGIEKVISWHTARRTVATLQLENGVDPFTVERMLGHTKIQTTAIYAHSTDVMKSKAVDGLPDILGVKEQSTETAGGNA